ncbi:hypothetical protein D3C86_1818940 [compost metagenome]
MFLRIALVVQLNFTAEKRSKKDAAMAINAAICAFNLNPAPKIKKTTIATMEATE